MKTANIAYTKNHLSALLARVKAGETILIAERNRPVARLEPVRQSDLSDDERLAQLAREGLVRLPKKPGHVKEFLALPTVKIKSGASVLQALLEEREEGR